MKPVLLDLYCGAGGCSRGYTDAGFEVIGVDNRPQPRYPYTFHQGDALKLLPELIDRYRPATLAGSPPCNDHSPLSNLAGKHGTGWLLNATIEAFEATGLPWVVENVERADLPGVLVLCGTEFGLRSGGHWLRRHRRFASNIFLVGAGGCHCAGKPIGGVYGTGGECRGHGYKFSDAGRREAMGIDWMTRAELSQAIPPAYTRFIGEQLLAHLTAAVTP